MQGAKGRPFSATYTTAGFGARCAPRIQDQHMNPKVSVYHSNGTGRDTYINFNNGGFRNITSSKFRIVYAPYDYTLKNCNINPKFAIYKSDGFGRDSYIVNSCGGFYKNYMPKKFVSTLREYDSYVNRRKYDYMYYANHFETPTQIKQRQEKFKAQRAVSTRLSRPKF